MQQAGAGICERMRVAVHLAGRLGWDAWNLMCHSIQCRDVFLLQHGSTAGRKCSPAQELPPQLLSHAARVCAGEPAFDFPLTTFYGTRDRRITEGMVQVGSGRGKVEWRLQGSGGGVPYGRGQGARRVVVTRGHCGAGRGAATVGAGAMFR